MNVFLGMGLSLLIRLKLSWSRFFFRVVKSKLDAWASLTSVFDFNRHPNSQGQHTHKVIQVVALYNDIVDPSFGITVRRDLHRFIQEAPSQGMYHLTLIWFFCWI